MTFRKINKNWLVESGACSLLEAVCNVFIPAKKGKEKKREKKEKPQSSEVESSCNKLLFCPGTK